MSRYRYAQQRLIADPIQHRSSLQSPQSPRVLNVSRLDHHAPLPHRPPPLNNNIVNF